MVILSVPEAAVRVGDDQPRTPTGPGGQRAQERQPARSNVAPVWRRRRWSKAGKEDFHECYR
jgi:hypothetical protein